MENKNDLADILREIDLFSLCWFADVTILPLHSAHHLPCYVLLYKKAANIKCSCSTRLDDDERPADGTFVSSNLHLKKSWQKFWRFEFPTDLKKSHVSRKHNRNNIRLATMREKRSFGVSENRQNVLLWDSYEDYELSDNFQHSISIRLMWIYYLI